MRPDGSGFVILTVCSGNICRSPLAEQLLRARLVASDRPYSISSAGTVADEGAPMDETDANLSRHYGGNPDGHLSRPLKAGMIAEAHLVVTATRAHRAAVVKLLPRASRYTFTLRQLTRLLAVVGPADRAGWLDPGDLVASVAAARGLTVPLDDEADDDIVDPYGRGLAVHERTAAEINHDVEALVDALRDVSAPGRPPGQPSGETTGQVDA
ncbi:MAG: hypothetical protein JWP75_665 [Frondihabitans sp.]|nr:hypothetical protein [Frondihabitans sp.]